VEVDPVVCVLDWATSNPGTRTRKQSFPNHLIETLSSLLIRLYKYFNGNSLDPDGRVFWGHGLALDIMPDFHQIAEYQFWFFFFF
jgi:hypothetical protein